MRRRGAILCKKTTEDKYWLVQRAVDVRMGRVGVARSRGHKGLGIDRVVLVASEAKPGTKNI
jgi:hypothetical protein